MITSDSSPGDRLATWGAALLATLALAWLQLSFDGLFDLDSYFHARAALDLAQHGVRTEFPQAAFSTWADRYSDKDFLFHVLIAPWVSEETLVSGGKWAVIATTALLFASVAYTIQSLGIRFGAVWLLLLVAASPYYVMRLVPLRPHTLGLAFIALELGLLVRDRWKTLFVVSALHVIAHSSFPILFGLYGLRFLAAALLRAPLPPRSGLAIAAGTGLALVVHPYFPNNIDIAWAQIFRLASHLWGGSSDIPAQAFGSELRPMAARTFFLTTPAWLPALAALIATIGLRGLRGWSVRDAFLALAVLAFLVIAFLSRRFLDMFILSAVLLSGGLWTALAQRRPLRALVAERLPLAATVAVSGCLAVGLALVWTELPGRFEEQNFADIFRPDVARLDELAAPDDVVYHPTWREFSYLYAFRPSGRYISGLDPVFLHEKSPDLFKKRWALSRGRVQRTHLVLTRDFDARWVFVTTEPRFLRFRQSLARSKGIERVWASEAAEIWSVQPVPGRRRG